MASISGRPCRAARTTDSGLPPTPTQTGSRPNSVRGKTDWSTRARRVVPDQVTGSSGAGGPAGRASPRTARDSRPGRGRTAGRTSVNDPRRTVISAQPLERASRSPRRDGRPAGGWTTVAGNLLQVTELLAIANSCPGCSGHPPPMTKGTTCPPIARPSPPKIPRSCWSTTSPACSPWAAACHRRR